MQQTVTLHSKLSFSGRDRWANCPASVHGTEDHVDTISPIAQEGTLAHGVAEFYSRQAFNLDGAVPGEPAACAPPEGLSLKGLTVDEWNTQLRQHGQAYMDFIKSQIELYFPGRALPFEYGKDYYVAIEKKVSIPSIHELLYGTADCLIFIPSIHKLIVIDYKYGFKPVTLGNFYTTNPQLAAYAIGGAEKLSVPVDTFRLAIFQPRIPTLAPQTLDLPQKWLQKERLRLRDDVAAVFAPGAAYNFKPGEHCRFCPRINKCPKAHDIVSTAVQAAGGLVDLATLPEDVVLDLWAAKAAFKSFWEDVDERIEKMAKLGNKRIEVKIGSGRRKWADPKNATLYLLALGRTDLLEPVAISAALPHLPEDLHAALVGQTAGSRTLVINEAPHMSEVAKKFQKYVKPVDFLLKLEQ